MALLKLMPISASMALLETAFSFVKMFLGQPCVGIPTFSHPSNSDAIPPTGRQAPEKHGDNL
jgi:hypothetical protein